MKSKLVSAQAKIKRGGTGEYWIVQLTTPEGNPLPRYLCFDPKIKEYKAGDIVEYDGVEKGGTWFLNFPREGGAKGYSKAAYAPRTDPKTQALLSLHTMTMAYAKDVVTKLIEVKLGMILDANQPHLEAGQMILELAGILRVEIANAPEIAAALELKAGSAPKEPVEDLTGLRKEFEKATADFIFNMKSMGYVLPDDALPVMLKRLSVAKGSDGVLIPGEDKIALMSDTQAKAAYEHFIRFNMTECEGDPKSCKFFQTRSMAGVECKLVVNCLYKNHPNQE